MNKTSTATSRNDRLAPIALFVYNRLKHTAQTVAALERNPLAALSDLIIFSDGPKNSLAEANVRVIRDYLKKIRGFKSIKIIARENNLGLAESIISGVSEVINQFGKVIILEDDLVTSPYFLQYMNEALSFYEQDERVISVHGYVYPVKQALPETFFLKGADCWGWATWRRAWNLFEVDGRKLLDELKAKKLTRQFDFDGAYPYTQMLEGQILGFNNSWAIRWHARAFLLNKLTLYPGHSLVSNSGMDNSGTHTGATKIFDSPIHQSPIGISPIPVLENMAARRAFIKYFSRPLLRLMTSRIRLKHYWKLIKKYGHKHR